jgi:host factor-I protein
MKNIALNDDFVINEKENEQIEETVENKTHKSLNLQDVFLNSVRRDKTMITVFLVNGFQLRGSVKGFDNYVILMEVEGKVNMIYKHAVSTIVPMKNVAILADKE